MHISLIVPVFNEEKAIRPFYDAVRRALANEADQVELIFINDGSQDGTERQIRQLIAGDPDVALIDLSRNFGKPLSNYAVIVAVETNNHFWLWSFVILPFPLVTPEVLIEKLTEPDDPAFNEGREL
ncbi:glycosyltransferase [Pseudomonas juntendi]|uniref:glycosyltransferase n=1 Tax=Pseudomonas juntendi TaxID=2666183 RepID=UPI00320BA0D9